MSDTNEEKSAMKARRTAAAFLVDVMDECLVLVKDESHYLYNPRVHYPPTEGIGLALAEGRQTKDIVAMKDGEDRFLIVDGRQEVISGRAHVKKHGGTIMVRVLVKRFKNPAEAVTFMNLADLRVKDDPIAIAERVQHSLKWLGTNVEVAKSMGWKSPVTAENYLKLLDLDEEVKAAVRRGPDKGGINETAGRRLADLPREQQREALKQMIETGATRGASAQKAVTEAKQGKKITGKVEGKKMLTRPFVTAFRSDLESRRTRA